MEQIAIPTVSGLPYGILYNIYFRFMFWLEDHLEEGSFKSCYADTDSMALALTRSGPEMEDPEASLRALFDPLVKPSKKASWEESWKSWFVTTNEIWDIRKPGKLKGKSGHFGHFGKMSNLDDFGHFEHFEKCSIFELFGYFGHCPKCSK